jgi:hypothetical protein
LADAGSGWNIDHLLSCLGVRRGQQGEQSGREKQFECVYQSCTGRGIKGSQAAPV